MKEREREREHPMDNLNLKPDPKMGQERLLEELQELRALTLGFLGTVPGAFIVLDNKWRLYYLNNDAKKLFEDNDASLLGKPLEEVYPRKLGKMLSPQRIRELLDGKENTINKYTSHLHRWFKISAYYSDFGIFIRLEDITPEMLLNRLLRLNEFSVSRAKDMVFWFKPGGHIIFANRSSCESLGYDSEELAKLKVTDIDSSFTADNWAEFVNDLKRESSRNYESSLRTRDGSDIPVEVTCNYLEYFGEEYLMAFARDITNRKRVDKALNEAKAEAELYVDLMSHDINNMNQTALGYLELALDRIRRENRIGIEDIELIAKPYDMVLNSSNLIDNVRKIQREKSGRYKSSVVDIGKVLNDIKSAFSSVAGRDIRIDIALNGECQVAANELVKDIFINLVGNSVKHSSGSLIINIEMKKVAENGSAFCRVSVEDNGPGIPDATKTKLLKGLSIENTKSRNKGFGLFLIKQLVDDFNGKFWMEDRVPGDHTKGARFVVMLPAIDN